MTLPDEYGHKYFQNFGFRQKNCQQTGNILFVVQTGKISKICWWDVGF